GERSGVRPLPRLAPPGDPGDHAGATHRLRRRQDARGDHRGAQRRPPHGLRGRAAPAGGSCLGYWALTATTSRYSLGTRSVPVIDVLWLLAWASRSAAN